MKALKIILIALLAAVTLSACGIIRLKTPAPIAATQTSAPAGLTPPPSSPVEEATATSPAAKATTAATATLPAVLPTRTLQATATEKPALQATAVVKPTRTLTPTRTAKATRTLAPTRTPTATRPTRTPGPTRTAVPTRPTRTPTSNLLEFTITLADSNRLAAGDIPFVEVLRSETGPVILPAVVLNRLFDGPSEDEKASGVVLIGSGFTRVRRLDIVNGVARIYLKGVCRPGGSHITIADLIFHSMEQFRGQIRTIKIYDENGKTRYPSGALDSAPRCLYP